MTTALIRGHLLSPRTYEDLAPSCMLLTAWTRNSVVRGVLTSVAASGDEPSDPDVVDEHLRADPDETEPRWLSIADVIVRFGMSTDRQGLSQVFARYPGCGIAAIVDPGEERCAVGGRTGWSAEIGRQTDSSLEGSRMFSWYASFAHLWMVSGRSPSALADAYVTIASELDGRGAVSTRRAISIGRKL